jgi:AraC family transcriptional regulator
MQPTSAPTVDPARALVRVERARGRLVEVGAPGRGLSPWQARKVADYIDAHLDQRIQVEDLTALARLSPRYFAAAFKRSFGLPPHAYLMRRRVERAQALMLATDMPLSAVSLACGLADQPHLTRLFGRIVGATPAQWRRERRLAA